MAKKTVEKATKTIAEKAVQKVGELAVENILRNKIPKNMQDFVEKPLSQEQKRNLQIFCKSEIKTKTFVTERSCEIKSNFDKRNLIKENFFSINISTC